MNTILRHIILIAGVLTPIYGYAVALPGLFDGAGKPVHTADEFTLSITANTTSVPQGYKYTYSLQSSPSSVQSIWGFDIKLPAVDGVVSNSTSSPWGAGGYPKAIDPLRDKYFPNFTYTPEALFVSWATYPDTTNAQILVPSGAVSGFTFISPYPPGISFAYAEGLTPSPTFVGEPASEDISLPFHRHTPYGPGKIIPVIGPVKPATLNVTDNYSVIGCVGGLCDVQLDITGSQDPYGTVYTYQWAGAFGTATGAKPVVQLAAGTYSISVTVSDPYATLVTATMPVTVVDPNPPVIVPPVGGNNGGGNVGGGTGQGAGGANGNGGQTGGNQGGGTTGGGTNGGNNGNGQGTGGNANPNGDIDHDGIPDNEDDDRDGDGKSNDQDDDPDHAG